VLSTTAAWLRFPQPAPEQPKLIGNTLAVPQREFEHFGCGSMRRVHKIGCENPNGKILAREEASAREDSAQAGTVLRHKPHDLTDRTNPPRLLLKGFQTDVPLPRALPPAPGREALADEGGVRL